MLLSPRAVREQHRGSRPRPAQSTAATHTSNEDDQLTCAKSQPGTPLYRTCAGPTTSSPPMYPSMIACAWRLLTSRTVSHRGGRIADQRTSACPTQQRGLWRRDRPAVPLVRGRAFLGTPPLRRLCAGGATSDGPLAGDMRAGAIRERRLPGDPIVTHSKGSVAPQMGYVRPDRASLRRTR